MIRDWLTTQLDFLLLLQGLVFLAVAARSYDLGGQANERLAWRWFALYAVLRGLFGWQNLLILSVGDPPVFYAARLIVMSGCLLAVVEFGRRGILIGDRPALGWWWIIVFAMIAAIGGFTGGWEGFDVASRYALALPGGVLVAFAFWRAANRSSRRTLWGLRLAAIAVVLLAVSTALATPGVSFSLASEARRDGFYAPFGFPLQFLRTMCGLGLLVGLQLHSRRGEPDVRNRPARRRWLLPAALTAFLGVTWLVADRQGREADAALRTALLNQGREIAGAISPDSVKELSFTANDKGRPAFESIRRQMIGFSRLSSALGLYSIALRNGEIKFGPENYAENDPLASAPGEPYEQPHAQTWDVLRTGNPASVGPYTDEYGTFVSAFLPVRDPQSGDVLMAVGLDVRAEQWVVRVSAARLSVILGAIILLLCLWTCLRIFHHLTRPRPAVGRRRGPAGADDEQSYTTVASSGEMRQIGLLVGMGVLAVAFLVIVLLQSWYWTRKHTEANAGQMAKLAIRLDHALNTCMAGNVQHEADSVDAAAAPGAEVTLASAIARDILLGIREVYPGLILRFPSTNPRNPINQATPAELKIIRYFEQHPDADCWTGTMKFLDGGETFFVRASPRRFDPACLRCHGCPEDAPTVVRDKHGDKAGFGWEEGNVSVNLAAIPIDIAHEAASGNIWGHMFGAIALCIAFLGGIAFLIRKDAQQRRQAENSLRESEERFRTTSEQTGHLIYDWDIATGRITWAGRVQEIVGYTAAEMNSLGITGWEERVHPDDRAQTTARLDSAMKNREPFDYGYRFRKADGAYIDVRDEGVFLYDQSDRATRMLGALKDISQHKRAEQALHDHMAEIERFNRIALGREHRIIELKRRINELSEMLGQPPPHPVPAADDLERDPNAEQPSFCLLPPKDPEQAPEETEFDLCELLDFKEVQRLLDGFCGAIGIAAAVIDLQGKVLMGCHWRRLCTDFHRVNPETLKRCLESDTVLANQLQAGEPFTLYQCRNGLTDAAAPIRIGRRHVANVFVGQFLLDPPDEQAFRRQAHTFGFDENDYMKALKEIPVIDRGKLPLILEFIVSFAKLAANAGLERLRGRQTQARLSKHVAELDRQRKAAVNLAEDAELARVVAERSEAALKTSEERFRTLIEQAADAVLLISPHRRILDANQEACRSLGYSRQELLTKRLADIDPVVAERPEIGDALDELKPGQRASFESVHRRKDGSEYPVEISVGVLELEGQRVWLGFSRDITERKLAEEKLRRATERAKELEFIIDRSPVTVWLVKAVPGLPAEYISEGIETLGYTQEDFTSGRFSFKEIVHPDDLARVLAEIEQHLQDGQTEFTQEYRVISRTGEVRWVNEWAWARRGPDGAVTHYQGIILDVTERRLAEQEQLAHLRFLESLDRVDQAIRNSSDLDTMVNAVLDVTLSVFGCDRAWLLHPCDPSVPFYKVPFERTTPDYPGMGGGATTIPSSQDHIDTITDILASETAIAFGPGGQRPLPQCVIALYRIQSELMVAIHTKIGSPWVFGLHQCSRARVWTEDERRIFEEIGRRLGSTLTNMLTLRDLRESEQRFRTLIEQAADAVMLISLEGHILDANQQACKNLGYTREELLSKSLADIDPKAAADHDPRLILRRLMPGHHATFESTQQRKDGSTFPVEVSFGIVELEGHRVSIGISRDITERKLAEERLRGAMERAKELELIINRSPATAWLWRVAPGWPVDYVSDSVSVFGYTPEDFTSGQVLFGDIIHPDDLSKVSAEVERHTKAGRTEFTQEYRIITRTGDIRWLSDWTWARLGPDGDISHYQGVTLDITERKQAEQEQLAHLRFLQSMDLIDKALRGTNDADQMLNDVLDVALSVFGCERAWLLHPCDPSAAFWRVPMERTVLQFPGAFQEGAVIPITPEAADMMQAALEAQGAVTFGPQAQQPLPPVIAARFHIQSQIAVLVRTKTGSPWMFGLHQCSSPRVWTADEKRLLEEIGRRVSDSLTAMLTLRDLRESEQRFRCVVEQASDCVILFSPQGQILDANKRVCDSLGYAREELLLMGIGDLDPTSVTDEHREQIWDKLAPGQSSTFESLFRRRDGSTFPIEVSLGALELDGQKVLLGLSRDISQRKAMEEELRAAAWTDRLTGLPNRALFLDRLQQAVLRTARTEDYRFAVLFLDFDRFKIINDSLGHKVGDQLLQEAAERLRTTVRAGDSLGRPVGQHTTARLGGDEFVVLLDGIKSAGDASLVADRLLNALSQPYHLGRHEVYSSVSIGIVTSDIAATSAEDVLRDADTAMYEAKLAGKGCYVVFDVSMRKRVQNRLSLEIDLRKAIDTNQFFLMYQPIVSLETRQVESLEVLARWKHPQRGLVSPAEFIPIAEDTGLIVPIGEWVLREACRQFTDWRNTHGDAAPRGIAVNLSRSQLLLADLPATITQILQNSGIPPSCLHMEITESAVMRDVDLVLKILHALKDIGVNLSMDDFGTGHSSLACLHQFPFDVLKIDQAFIATINHGRDHAALVHAVVSLARNLDISVVAEGIETADQLLMLQALGCHYGQGYFLGKPMMANQVIDYRVPLADGPTPGKSKPTKKSARKKPSSTPR